MGRVDNQLHMENVKVNGHKLQMYDSIDEMPMDRFVQYNRALLLDAGIGSNVDDISGHLAKLQSQLKHKLYDDLSQQLSNYHQALVMAVSEPNLKTRAFAALVKSVNGKPFNDLTDESISNLQKKLTFGVIRRFLESVKKNLKLSSTFSSPK